MKDFGIAMQQLTRFQLKNGIARSLYGNWASCETWTDGQTDKPTHITLIAILRWPPGGGVTRQKIDRNSPVSPGEVDETTSVLILPHWRHYVKTWRHPRNRKYLTRCTAVKGRPGRGHTENFVKFEIGQTQRHAGRYSDTLIAVGLRRTSTGRERRNNNTGDVVA